MQTVNRKLENSAGNKPALPFGGMWFSEHR